MGRSSRRKWVMRALRIQKLRTPKKGKRTVSVADSGLAARMERQFAGPQLQRATVLISMVRHG